MPTRLVVLDGHTLNPGDIDWKGFAALGELTVHDRTPEDQVVARAQNAACVLTNKTPLTAATLAKLPELKYIGVLATGYNIVDTAAAAAKNIVVTNVPTYGTESVAQHATALMLELARSVSAHAAAVRQGQWTRCPDFCFAVGPIYELNGRTLGLVGLGRIGLAFARIAAAMGMKLIAYDLHWPTPDRLAGLTIERVDLDEVFARADVLSLHCPLTKDNQHLVNAARLAKMKKSALLINTSRGPLVDNHALAAALRAGTIAGAGLDVLEIEPPPADNPLLTAPRCVVTPHVSWYAVEARRRLMDIAVENYKAFLAGRPVNVVS